MVSSPQKALYGVASRGALQKVSPVGAGDGRSQRHPTGQQQYEGHQRPQQHSLAHASLASQGRFRDRRPGEFATSVKISIRAVTGGGNTGGGRVAGVGGGGLLKWRRFAS